MPELPTREIIRDAEFEDQLARLMPNAEEADDFTLGAEFVLAREPREGVPASADGTIWTLDMCPVRGRQVTLYYSFDAETVTFLAILADE